MAISANQTPGNGLRHTSTDTPGEPGRTTATAGAGSADTAIHRFGALLGACIHEIYIIGMGQGLSISRSIIEKTAASCSMTNGRAACGQIHTTTA